MKKTFFILGVVLMSFFNFSQGIIMHDGVVNQLCDTNFYDSGGIGATGTSRYANDEHYVLTFYPLAGKFVRLDFSYFDVHQTDLLTIYDGENTDATMLGAYNNQNYTGGVVMASLANTSGALTVEFFSSSSGRAGGWIAKVECAYQCQAVIAEAEFSTADQNSIVKVCQGTNMEMNGSGEYPANNQFYLQEDATSIFSWIVIYPDGSQQNLTGNTQNIVFSEEGIYETWLFVEDINGCSSTNTEQMMVFVSTTPSFANYSIQNDSICLGSQNVLEINPEPVMAVQNCAPPVGDTLFLPDGDGTFYETEINVSCYAPNQTLQNGDDVEVCINMEHSYLGDLSIELICPSGERVFILDFSQTDYCGSEYLGIPNESDGLIPGTGLDYCFSSGGSLNLDEQANLTGSHITIPVGTYLPFESFQNLVGCELNGAWGLRITDNLSDDNGYIFSWDVHFNSAIPTNTENSFTPILNSGWVDDPAITQSSGNQIVVTPVTVGQNCFSFQVTDDFGCQYDTSLCFYVKNGSQTPTFQNVDICSGDVFQAINLGSEISWYNNNISIGLNGSGDGSIETFVAQDLSGQINTAEITLINEGGNCGAGDTSTFMIVVNPIPIATVVGDLEVCQNDTIVLTIADFNGQYFYDWSDPFQSNAQTVSIPLATDQAVTLNISNNGCSVTQTFALTALPQPPIDAGADISVCHGQDLTLNATGGENYQWSTGQTGGAVQVYLEESTILTVIGEGSNGCLASDEVLVTILNSDFQSMDDMLLCEGDTALLNAIGLNNLSWTGGVVNNLPFVPQVGTEMFILSGYDELGCQVTDTVLISVQSKPLASFTFEDDPYYIGSSVSFDNTSVNAQSYTWNINGTLTNQTAPNSISYTFNESGEYEIKLLAINGGCMDDTLVKLFIHPFLPVEFNLPNIFTPKGDAKNDIFYIETKYAAGISVQIFNRWGNLVKELNGIFNIEDDNTYWDGNINGKKASEGTYFFSFYLQGLDGQEYKGSSTIQLVR